LLTAKFSKTVVHPPLRAISLYRIFVGESITNDFIVLLPSDVRIWPQNHAPEFLLAAYPALLVEPLWIQYQNFFACGKLLRRDVSRLHIRLQFRSGTRRPLRFAV